MKIKFLFFSFGILVCFFCKTAIGQDCKCIENGIPKEDKISFLPEDTSRKFMGHYNELYRIPRGSNKHSISVDFSKKAFLEFYREAFTNRPNIYIGIAFHFASFDNFNERPGQFDKKQISLILAPIKCKDGKLSPDYPDYMIRNNSYNQDSNNYQTTQYSFRLKRRLAMSFKDNYDRNYWKGADHGPDEEKKYTRFLFLEKEVIDFFADFLTARSEYDGIRVFFASYNREKVICKQASKTQLTLLIAPVKKGGAPDFKVWSGDADFLPEKTKNLHTVNHGALCPNNCN